MAENLANLPRQNQQALPRKIQVNCEFKGNQERSPMKLDLRIAVFDFPSYSSYRGS